MISWFELVDHAQDELKSLYPMVLIPRLLVPGHSSIRTEPWNGRDVDSDLFHGGKPNGKWFSSVEIDNGGGGVGRWSPLPLFHIYQSRRRGWNAAATAAKRSSRGNPRFGGCVVVKGKCVVLARFLLEGDVQCNYNGSIWMDLADCILDNKVGNVYSSAALLWSRRRNQVRFYAANWMFMLPGRRTSFAFAWKRKL